MIFDTNFLQGEHRAEQWLRRGTQMALAIATAFAIGLAIRLSGMHSDAAALDQALDKLQGQTELAKKEYDMRMEGLPDGIGRSLESLSALPTYQGRSTSALLYQLEKRLPREMYLSQFRHDRIVGTVTLEARTRDGAAVSELLKNLEEVDGVTAVRMLGRESGDDGGVVVRVSFREGKESSGAR